MPQLTDFFFRWQSWLIVGLGLLVRLAYGLWLGPALLDGDGGSYLLDAFRLLSGTPYQPYWPPGMSHLLAIVVALLGPGWLNLLGLMLGLYVLFDWLLRKVLKAGVTNAGSSLPGVLRSFSKEGVVEENFRDRSGEVPFLRLLFALSPVYIHHSTAPLSQLPLAICILGLVWGFSLNKTWQRALLWGFALGLGILFRPGMAALGLLLLLKKRMWPAAIGAGLLALTLVLVWEFQVYQQHHRWITVNDANAYNLYLGNNPWTPPYRTWSLGSHDLSTDPAREGFYAQRDSIRRLSLAEQQRVYRQLAWEEIGRRPGAFVQRVGSRFRVFFAFDTYTAGVVQAHSRWLAGLLLLLDGTLYLYLLLAAVNAFWGRTETDKVRFWAIGVGLYTLPYLLAFSHPTYHFPLLPLLALMALQGNTLHWRSYRRLWQTVSGKRRVFWLLSLFVCLYIQLEWLLDVLQRSLPL